MTGSAPTTASSPGAFVSSAGEYELVLRPRNADEGRTLPDDVGVVTLDTTVDDELESEGPGARRGPPRPERTARRRPPRLGLHHVGDRRPGRRPAAALGRIARYVAEQTLAVELRITDGDSLDIKLAKTPCP